MANTPISGLNPGGPVEDTDLFPDVQTVGVGPVKVTGAQIKIYTSTSPTFITPDIGVAHGTSLALGGATIGSNALAVTGTADFNSAVTLGTQQTIQGQLVLSNTAAGSYETTLKSSNSSTSAWTFTLPPDSGTNGYVLTTNGSGISVWTNPTALGIDIDVNSTSITGGTSGHLVYDNAGKFGEMSAITTDGAAALTLGTQQTTQGTVVLANTALGSFSTTIKSSNSATESWALTLPVSKGSNGYILTTDGTGVSAWTNPTALGIDIDVNSTAITGGTSGRIVYDNAGTFGEASAITTNGSDTLTVGTQQSTQGLFVLSNTAAGAFPVTLKSSNSTSAAWTFTLPTTAGTNKYALTTNGSGVSSWSQIDLAAAVTGTLPVGNGGTGQTSLAVHGVVIGNSTSGVNVTATGSAGQVFQSGGALADPVWSTATFPATATSAGTILRADGTNWVSTTATYPTTTTINQILYSDANNQVTGLTTTNGGVVNTNSSGVPSVTVNPTLGVQQTTQGSLVLANTAAGAFATTLKSSNSASEAWTLTLPVSKGTNGYILTTDGTGVSSWTNPTALGIDIDVNSTAITNGTSGRIVYDNSGTFGEISAITTNGSNALTIGTQQSSQGSLILSNTAVGSFATTIQSSNSSSAAWTLTLPTTAGTNNYVLTTNGSGVSSWSQVSLTAGVTGVLPAANGGTGQSTNTLHGVLIGNAGSAINATTAGSSGQLLQSGGASADPTWTTATFPSTATGTGTLLRADGTNWSATTATYPTTTIAGTILVSDTANTITGSSNPVLGVQQTTQGSIVLANTAAGAFSTTLKSSNSATEAWTLTLPVSKGSNGYILTTDGTGVSSWTNPTALGIDIDINSTAITSGTSGRLLFDNSATVGETSAITTNGSGTLTIGAQQTTQGSLVLANTATGAFQTTVQSSNSASAAWTLTLPTTAGTNNYVLTTNGFGTSSWAQVSLTAGVTGILPVANGGTGQSTNTLHGVLIGNAANAINATSAGSAGQLLTSGGAAADPLWTTATFPSTATSTGAILRADGTNWAATTATYPTTTSAGTLLVSATANTVTGSATPTLGVAGTTVGTLSFANATSGSIQLSPTTGALGSSVITMPATTGTMTVLGNTVTGSGSIVLATSPSLTTPTLGAATGTSLALGGATIGTNALAITGTSLLDGVQWINVNSSTTSQYLKFGNGTTAYAAIGGYYDSASTGHLEFYATTGSTLTEYMRITDAGDVGIGTGSPGTKLNVYTNSATNTFARIQNTLAYADIGPLSNGTIYGPYCSPAASTSLTIGTSNANPIRIYTNATERARIDSSGNFVINTAAIATNATDGFLYIPTCAGTPTGTPTAYTGRSAVVYDSTNNKLYVYNGAWKSATFA